MEKKFAVLVSGTGTLLDAVIVADINISLVLADRPCLGLEKAKAVGIPTELLRRTDFGRKEAFNREEYTLGVVSILKRYGIDFVSMAGFMTVLSDVIFVDYKGRIINNHPSLLPLFKGEDAVGDALAAGVKETGCTIHIATEVLDDERMILGQVTVPVLPNDTKATLHERIKVQERILLPQVIRKFAETI